MGLFNVLIEEHLELENLEIDGDIFLPLFVVFLTFQDREGGEIELIKGINVNEISFRRYFCLL